MYADVKLEMLQHHNNYPDQLKSVRESEASVFRFPLNLMTVSKGQGHSKSCLMVEIDGAYKHGRCDKFLW